MSLSFAARVANFLLRWKVKPKRDEPFALFARFIVRRTGVR